MVARNVSGARPPWLETDQPVHAVLDRELRVFRAVDAFEHHLHLCELLQAIEGRPGRVGGIEVASQSIVHRTGNRSDFDTIVTRPPTV